MKQKFARVLTAFAVAFTLFLPTFPAQAAVYEPDFEMDSAQEGILLLSLDTGQVLFEQNADTKMAPASLTKIMTTILALENTENWEEETATAPDYIYDEFVGLNVSTANILRGEQLTIQQLVYAMMLQSANEGASVVADHFGGGSIDKFCQMMNQKATELGCTNTHFVNPHGLDADNHYSTPRDMAKSAQYALSLPNFSEVCESTRYTIPQTNKQGPRTLVTTVLMQDRIRGGEGVYSPYIKGIKTGTTDNAGRCVVTRYQNNGKDFLLVIMGAPMEGTQNKAFLLANKLFSWADKNFTLKTPLKEGEAVHQVKVAHSFQTDNLLLQAGSDVSLLMPTSADESSVQLVVTLDSEKVAAPVEKGQKLGTVTLKLGGEPIGETTLVAAESVKRSTLLWVVDSINGLLATTAAKVILVLLGLAVAAYVVYVVLAIRREKKKRRIKRNRKYKM